MAPPTKDPALQLVDGRIVLSWPHGKPATVRISPELLETIVSQLNELRTLTARGLVSAVRVATAPVQPAVCRCSLTDQHPKPRWDSERGVRVCARCGQVME